MPRVFIKGGPWRNTEDEILKAAIMKYGINQWARVASLLPRKSAKQCKARWYEWLDPSIKKTEWTREEEEKLLHLAKIMPNQWRTIAPIIGRTATQCLQHYERLLDQATQRDMNVDASDDPRRLRPGESDPNLATRPARPDPIDMDEDEKDMLNEARARLANTRGKKAKRKAREKALEEARRLASLQKRRELKAAGVHVPTQRKLRFMNYNEQIPFERIAPTGFFDTTEEKKVGNEMAEAMVENFTGVTLDRLGLKKTSEIEQEQLKKDKLKQKKMKEEDPIGYMLRINRIKDVRSRIKRSALSLPAPQVTDKELAEIASLGYSPSIEGAGGVTGALLNTYKPNPTPTPMRTPRTETAVDSVRLEAENLARLRESQTPLLGGSNVQLHETFRDFDGITPRRKEIQTPNPLATPHQLMTPSRNGAMTPSQTPSKSVSGMTPRSTPLRDEMGINPKDTYNEMEYDDSRLRQDHKRELRNMLKSLPAPKNEYKLVAPELDSEMDVDERLSDRVPDAVDVAKAQEEERRRKQEEEFRRSSQAVQRNLPRPSTWNSRMKKAFLSSLSSGDLRSVESIIMDEMALLIRHDAERFPFSRGSVKKAPPRKQGQHVELETIEEDSLQQARLLISDEISTNSLSSVLSSLDESDVAPVWESLVQKFVFSPSHGTYMDVDSVDDVDQARRSELQEEYQALFSVMQDLASRAKKLESKLELLTLGLSKRGDDLSNTLSALYASRYEMMISISCYDALRRSEEIALPERKRVLQEIVDRLRIRENDLQMEFKRLVSYKRDVMDILIREENSK